MLCLTNHPGSQTIVLTKEVGITTAAFTVRVRDDIAKKRDRIAALSDLSRPYLAAQAIEDYVAREEWQLAGIQAGADEAGRGEFASADELASVIAKHVNPARNA